MRILTDAAARRANFLLLLLSSLLIASCNGGGTPLSSDTPVDDYSLSIGITQNSVKTDNSDSVTITATVLKNNAPEEGVTVNFTTTGGQLSAASQLTDASGNAIITFTSGSASKENREVTITASADGYNNASVPIQITGTTVTLSIESTNLSVPDANSTQDNSTTLSIRVADAGDVGIYDAPITISQQSDDNGEVSLTVSEGRADVNGELEVGVEGASRGTVILTVSALGATARQTLTVTTSELAFGISYPASSSETLTATTGSMTVVVAAPTQTSVQFVTSIGIWDGQSSVVTKTVVNSQAEAVLTSTEAGLATIMVTDADNSQTTDSTTIAISAPLSDVAKVAIETTTANVAPSTGETQNSVAVTAKVTNATDQGVANVPVNFSIANPTTGGESVSPPLVYTDADGKAVTSFYSGSASTDSSGVTITATELTTGTQISASTSIVIGGTAGSVVLGRGTKITASSDNTYYILPMSVLVADSNGNPVQNATVSLNLLPTEYMLGYWEAGTSDCPAIIQDFPSGSGVYYFANEDTNLNLNLDPGEDIGPFNNGVGVCGFQGDGKLTPPNSAAGQVPTSVTTDEFGVAGFDFTYLKEYAVWTKVRLTASTRVFGTETQTSSDFWLVYMVGDGCELPPSPYGYYGGGTRADAGGDQSKQLVEGESNTVALDGSNSSFIACSPGPFTYRWSVATVPSGSGVTDASLSAPDAIYTSFTPDVAGDYIVQLTITDGLGGINTDSVTITAY